MIYATAVFFLFLSHFFFKADGEELIRYKMYCMYTPNFECLFQKFFLPSLKDNFELKVRVIPQECFSGNFRTEGWDKTMLRKLILLQDAILENWEQVFFYSDIDIIFFKPIIDDCLKFLGDKDVVAQQAWPKRSICAGFLVMRGNAKTLELISKATALLAAGASPDDQKALQDILCQADFKDCSWDLLPINKYSTGRAILIDPEKYYEKGAEFSLSDSLVLFHANYCIGLENKVDFLWKVQEKMLEINALNKKQS